jgi:hypothetical protein
LMRDLPPGLIETPSLSVSMETSDTLPNVVVKGGDIAVNWTTSSHCTANHILRALLLDVNTVRNAAPLLNKVPHPSAGSKDTLTHPQPLPLSYYSTKLSKSCSLSVDVSKVTINTTVNKVFRFVKGNSLFCSQAFVQVSLTLQILWCCRGQPYLIPQWTCRVCVKGSGGRVR